MLSGFLTLPIGLVVEFLLFYLLYRFSPLHSVQSLLVALLLTLAVYLPYSLLNWSGVDVFVLHLAVFATAVYITGIILRSGKKSTRRFHWAPALIILFFVVIIVVDSVFVTMSMRGLPKGLQESLLPTPRKEQGVSTLFPGVVPENKYQKESQYNAYIAQRTEQAARGWQVGKGWLQGVPAAGQEAVFQLQILDRLSQPVSGLNLKGRFMRPADSRLDLDFSMNEVMPGVYRVAVVLPVAGTWDLLLDALDDDKQVYELKASTTITDK